MSAVPATSKTHPMLSGLRHAELRGVWLSHLLGFSFFFQLVLPRILLYDLPFTKAVDLPIRLVALWLVIDRIGRKGKVKVSGWDIAYLGFTASFALALVYADVFMQREQGFQNYFSWTLEFLSPYLYFVIAREGTLRRGFQPQIVLNWMIGTISLFCVIALLQATNIAGMRSVIDNAVHQQQAELKIEGPSQPWQARGLFVHANAMAIFLMMGLSLAFGFVGYRRATPFVAASIGLFILTTFATFSRTGMASIMVLAMAFVGLYLVERKYKQAMALAAGIAALLFVFVMIVYTFKIERFQVFVKGVGVIKNEPTRGIMGWYAREEAIKNALKVSQNYPLFGVRPASSSNNLSRVYRKNAYSYEGLLLNSYVYSWVFYGLAGVVYLLAIFYMTMGQIRHVRSNLAFAPAAVLCGVGVAVTSISENTLFTAEHMIIVNIVMAFALQKLVKGNEATFEDNPFSPKWMQWLGIRQIGPRWQVAKEETTR